MDTPWTYSLGDQEIRLGGDEGVRMQLAEVGHNSIPTRRAPAADQCPPVSQSPPAYPGWQVHTAVPFATWHVPPFWHTLVSHGDSSAAGQQREGGGSTHTQDQHTVSSASAKAILGKDSSDGFYPALLSGCRIPPPEGNSPLSLPTSTRLTRRQRQRGASRHRQ